MSDAGSVRLDVVVAALNLLFIAALPRVFFLPGRLNAQWWLTAAPFGAAGAALVYALLSGTAPAHAMLPVGAVLLGCASIALIAFTLGTHRQPVSLWHQEDDAPRSIVCHGAYARVRHPFYAAFLLALSGCVLAAPGFLSAAALAAAALRLHRTAVREEQRLLRSAFGAGYAAYLETTGRFVPRPQPSPRAPERT